MNKSKIILEYLYRDAGNYKLYEKALIENPNKLLLPEFEKWFRSQLIDELYFDPHNFGITKPHFSNYYPELDHDWCEFISLCEES